jgi:hypothetical protein
MEVIEMNHMVLNVLDSFNNIAQDSRVIGDFYPKGIFDCSHGAECMHCCSNPSNALGDCPCLPGISVFEDQFNPAEHGAGTPRVGYHTIVHLNLDPQVPFNPGNRVNY